MWLSGEAELARGAFGAEVVGELEGGAGAGGDGGGADGWIGLEAAEGEEAGGLVEAEACAELTGGGSDDATAEGWVEGAETVEFDGDGGFARGGADGASSATNGFAGEKELGERAGEFGLPAGLFFAGELGEVGEDVGQIWVVVAKLR